MSLSLMGVSFQLAHGVSFRLAYTRMLSYEKALELCKLFSISIDYLLLGDNCESDTEHKINYNIFIYEVLNEMEREFLSHVFKMILLAQVDEKMLIAIEKNIAFTINQVNFIRKD